ncbi:MAG: hypothetical protein ABSH35_26405 [Isosphaeraceae bacterium]
MNAAKANAVTPELIDASDVRDAQKALSRLALDPPVSAPTLLAVIASGCERTTADQILDQCPSLLAAQALPGDAWLLPEKPSPESQVLAGLTFHALEFMANELLKLMDRFGEVTIAPLAIRLDDLSSQRLAPPKSPEGDVKPPEAPAELPDHVTLDQAPGATTPEAPTAPIALGGPDDAPIVRGIEKDILTPTEYRVVKAMLDAFPKRLAGDNLARKSEAEDPVGAIDRLIRDKDWASVLSKAGKPHGGYGIVSTPRKTQKNRETRPRKPRG